MDALLLDIKILIAEHNSGVWTWFYIYDREFANYALSSDGITHCVRAFTKCWIDGATTLYTLLGYPHRIDGPAIITANNDAHYYFAGKRHRDNDLPAAEYNDGSKYWYVHGKAHREGDYPSIVNVKQYNVYNKHGLVHRIGGPAVIRTNGLTEWWENGKRIK